MSFINLLWPLKSETPIFHLHTSESSKFTHFHYQGLILQRVSEEPEAGSDYPHLSVPLLLRLRGDSPPSFKAPGPCAAIVQGCDARSLPGQCFLYRGGERNISIEQKVAWTARTGSGVTRSLVQCPLLPLAITASRQFSASSDNKNTSKTAEYFACSIRLPSSSVTP